MSSQQHLSHSMRLVRATAADPDFAGLVVRLDADLAIRDGADHAFYAQFNKIDQIQYAMIAYLDDIPCGCGAMKEYDPETMEVKRMYTAPEARGRGIASAILHALEQWAAELGYRRCILETGLKQPEAIGLYSKSGYIRMPNYGQYAGLENSVCFEKVLI